MGPYVTQFSPLFAWSKQRSHNRISIAGSWGAQMTGFSDFAQLCKYLANITRFLLSVYAQCSSIIRKHTSLISPIHPWLFVFQIIFGFGKMLLASAAFVILLLGGGSEREKQIRDLTFVVLGRCSEVTFGLKMSQSHVLFWLHGC